MAAPRYFVPGIVLLSCAFVLSLLVAISLPYLPTLDIVRCRFTIESDVLPQRLLDIGVSPSLLQTLTTVLIPFCVLSLSAVWCLVRKSLRLFLYQ